MITYPFAVGDIATRVIEAGSGGNVLVFIHGLGARADRWARNLEGFARAGYHCYALDLPGHGFATKGSTIPADVPGFAQFLHRFLAAMGIAKPVLVGTSLGGHVAGYFLCENPGQARALIMVGAVGLVPIGAEAGDAIRRNVKQTARDAIRRKMEFVLADPALVTEELVEEEFRINNSPGAAESFALLGDYIAERIDRHNALDRLKGQVGKTPMLLVWGERDKVVPLAIGESARASLGAVELVVVPAAGHAPYYEDAITFNREILRFLSSLR